MCVCVWVGGWGWGVIFSLSVEVQAAEQAGFCSLSDIILMLQPQFLLL